MRRVAGKLRPRDVDRAVSGDMNRIVIGELPRRPTRLAVAIERSHERERLTRVAFQPRLAPICRTTQQQHDAVWICRLIAETRKVRGAIWSERDRRIATEIILAGAWHGRIVRVFRDARKEAVRQ